MNIGTAAEKSGVATKTIRYYESVGLIAPALRSDNGYRVYDDAGVESLRFIQRARSLGFSVKDTASLLALWQDRDRSSAAVKQMARSQVAAIDCKIAELDSMRRTLIDLIERCHGDARPNCPILDDFARGHRGR